MKIRIGTFNVENLIYRFDFSNRGREFSETYEEREILISNIDERDEYAIIKSAVMLAKSDVMRQLTAQVIADMECDIVCLQEIDELAALRNFNRHYVSKSVSKGGMKARYKFYRLIEGNDPRGIDIGMLSKDGLRPITKSHANLTFEELGLYNDKLADAHINPSDRLFRRDCLEAEFDIEGQKLTLFVCHFKSQGGSKKRSDAIRNSEAHAVRQLIEAKFGDDINNSNWIVLGDLNESAWSSRNIDSDQRRVSLEDLELRPLLENDFSFNAIETLDKKERWTHYWASDSKYSQLDYILLSPKLAEQRDSLNAQIYRAGLPMRAGGSIIQNNHQSQIVRFVIDLHLCLVATETRVCIDQTRVPC